MGTVENSLLQASASLEHLASAADGHRLSNGCPSEFPHRYPGTFRCFERVWGENACNVDPLHDPVWHHRGGRQCVYDGETRLSTRTLSTSTLSTTTNTLSPSSGAGLCYCGFPEACMVVPQAPCSSDDNCSSLQGCGGRLFCSTDGTQDMQNKSLEPGVPSQAECDQIYTPTSPPSGR